MVLAFQSSFRSRFRSGVAIAALLSLMFACVVIARPGDAAPVSGGALAALTVAPTPAAPGAVGTGAAAPVSTGGAAPVATGGANGAAPVAGAGNNATNTQGTSTNNGNSLLAWVIGILAIAALAAGAVFFMMRRSAPVAEAGLAGDGDYDAPAPPAAPAVVAAAPALAPPPAVVAPAPAEIRCPNCSTLNAPGRRFCDECGQDLRPAAAAPAAVVDEAMMPYLETVSRVDEQLEFVLARSIVTVGRATDNDIVVDEQFAGWQTVSEHHARLTQEADGFVVEDLKSENGTFVNGDRTDRNLLTGGMTIAFGSVGFIYRVP